MYLPNVSRAIVERSKIVDYLLALERPEGFAKARFFQRFGFGLGNWQALADALLAHAGIHQIAFVSESRYGIKYQVDGPMPCPDGRSPLVRTIWIIDMGTDAPRLVTAHPL